MGANWRAWLSLALLLIAAGCDKKPAAGTTTELHRAAELGDLPRVRSLISKGAEIDAKDKRSLTPLHLAASQGHPETVKVLIANGADPNARTATNETPLHMAAAAGYESVVEILLASGADVNARDGSGWTPLHCAMRADKPIVIVELLLAGGADVNTRTGRGRTALHLAADYGDANLVKFLIGKGANINAREQEWGCTPMHYATKREDPDAGNIIDLLLSAGAKIEERTDSGLTPLPWRFVTAEGKPWNCYLPEVPG
jgi:ankyrin repeat protein